MSIRAKILIVTASVSLIFIAALLAITRFLLLESYIDLDHQMALQNARRLENSLSDEFDTLSRQTADWSSWDDTYEFARDLNTTYIEDNLMDDTFVNLDLNIMVFIDPDGEILYIKSVDLDAGKSIPAPDLTTIIYPDSPILNFPELTGAVTGFAQTQSGVLRFVTRPLLTNEDEGPSTGTLLFGRYMTEDRVQSLGDSLQIDLTAIYLQQDASIPAAASSLVNSSGASSVQPIVNIIDETHLQIYEPVMDIFGDPILLFELQMPRTIYTQGFNTTLIFSAAIITLILIITIAVLILLQTQVLQRMIALRDFFRTVRETDDLSIQLPVNGNDEITQVTHDLNAMVTALAQTRKELQQSHATLEQRVKERTIELARARDEALDAVRIKTEILANVSHDVRTPLNVIMLQAEMIALFGELNDKQKYAIQSINQQSNELLVFFNNILHEAQSQTSNFRLNHKAIAVEAFARQLEETMQPLAENKQLAFAVSVDEHMPDTVYGDNERLKQIVSNVVNNAIKFTAEGSVKVFIRPHEDTQWHIEVTDTGTGISPEAIPHIFEPFYQADGSITRSVNRGVGLGLSIVKRLVTLMGGKITVDATHAQGTTFTIILPINTAAQSAAEPTIAR